MLNYLQTDNYNSLPKINTIVQCFHNYPRKGLPIFPILGVLFLKTFGELKKKKITKIPDGVFPLNEVFPFCGLASNVQVILLLVRTPNKSGFILLL